MITRKEAQEQVTILTARIERLQHILSSNIYNVKIIFFTGSDYIGQLNTLDNTIIPFSLEGEIRLLLDDSITELERQRESFKYYANKK